jgi:predicted cation transporter
MIIGLLVILALIFILPFAFPVIEHNLEYFLLSMGVLAVLISGAFSAELLADIFKNYLLYLISGAVLVAGLIFRFSVKGIHKFVSGVINRIPLSLFLFLLIVVLGFISSFITAIIAALLLVEIAHALPFNHRQKVQLTVITCFSIGLGAALTPIGEPLTTIVTTKLNAGFLYLFSNIGIYVVPAIIALGIIGALFIGLKANVVHPASNSEENNLLVIEDENIIEMENLQSVFVRTLKIFLFIIALELLGTGFKPLINQYIIQMDSRILYWINMSSAVLDNATIAAAEISPSMDPTQIRAILMGLLLSGGMLIPGNIPNIISAGKLNIKSREWAMFAIPLGAVLLLIYYLIIFIL